MIEKLKKILFNTSILKSVYICSISVICVLYLHTDNTDLLDNH